MTGSQTSEKKATRPIGSRRAFTSWLARQPPFRRFKRLNSCHCPLAVFSGHQVFTAYYRNNYGMALLPDWAQEFIRRWDDSDAEFRLAATARHIMRKIK